MKQSHKGQAAYSCCHCQQMGRRESAYQSGTKLTVLYSLPSTSRRVKALIVPMKTTAGKGEPFFDDPAQIMGKSLRKQGICQASGAWG